jgi:hypothetical protein
MVASLLGADGDVSGAMATSITCGLPDSTDRWKLTVRRRLTRVGAVIVSPRQLYYFS